MQPVALHAAPAPTNGPIAVAHALQKNFRSEASIYAALQPWGAIVLETDISFSSTR